MFAGSVVVFRQMLHTIPDRNKSVLVCEYQRTEDASDVRVVERCTSLRINLREGLREVTGGSGHRSASSASKTDGQSKLMRSFSSLSSKSSR